MNFSEDAKTEFNNSITRDFFIGYHIGKKPFSYISEVSAKTTKKVASLNCGVKLAIYQP